MKDEGVNRGAVLLSGVSYLVSGVWCLVYPTPYSATPYSPTYHSSLVTYRLSLVTRHRGVSLLQRQSVITRWCERIIEGGWLLALVLIPSYFNLLSARHFEPDKATTLRSIVLIMLAAALVFWIERLSRPAAAPQRSPTGSPAPPTLPWWRRMLRYPMMAAIGLYMLVSIIATLASVTPNASFWGS